MPADMLGFPGNTGALSGPDMGGLPPLTSGAPGPDMAGFPLSLGYLIPFRATTLYSMRRRNPAYAGPCLRVRNNTTNVESDIPFGPDGWCSKPALLAAAGQPAAAQTVAVTTWYDQSGNGKHATNATANTQPYVVFNGVVNVMQGQAVLRFNQGSFAQLLATVSDALFGFGTGAWTVEAFCQTGAAVTGGANSPLASSRTGANPGEWYIEPATGKMAYYNGTAYPGATTILANTDYYFAWSYEGGPLSAQRQFLGGTLERIDLVTQDFTSARIMTVGNDGSAPFKDLIGELAFYKGQCLYKGTYAPRKYT